jgi:hypothetical protein
LSGFGGPVVFEEGAMPRLVDLEFDFPVQRTREINGSFDLGLVNLPSLQQVEVWLQPGGAGEQDVEEAKVAVRHAIEVHPNHPTIKVNNFCVDEAYALLVTSPLSPFPLSSNLNILCFFSVLGMNYMPRLADLLSCCSSLLCSR